MKTDRNDKIFTNLTKQLHKLEAQLHQHEKDIANLKTSVKLGSYEFEGTSDKVAQLEQSLSDVKEALDIIQQSNVSTKHQSVLGNECSCEGIKKSHKHTVKPPKNMHRYITKMVQQVLYSHNVEFTMVYSDINACGERNIFGRGIKFWHIKFDTMYTLQQAKNAINEILYPYNLYIADHFFRSNYTQRDHCMYGYSRTIHSLVVYQK